MNQLPGIDSRFHRHVPTILTFQTLGLKTPTGETSGLEGVMDGGGNRVNRFPTCPTAASWTNRFFFFFVAVSQEVAVGVTMSPDMSDMS